MTLDRLWAGWRSEFVGGGDVVGDPAADECVFCAILAAGGPDAGSHVLWRHSNGQAIAILNRYPYTTGHLMVMPTRHVGELEALTVEESIALWQGLTAATGAIKAAYRPHALNLGANIGRAAGAGVPGHFHVHLVPRWNGDTNFMTAIADTRVLPEALSETDRKLRAAWPS